MMDRSLLTCVLGMMGGVALSEIPEHEIKTLPGWTHPLPRYNFKLYLADSSNCSPFYIVRAVGLQSPYHACVAADSTRDISLSPEEGSLSKPIMSLSRPRQALKLQTS